LDEYIFRDVVNNFVTNNKSDEAEDRIITLWVNLIKDVEPNLLGPDAFPKTIDRTRHFNTLDYHDGSDAMRLFEDDNMKSAPPPPQNYYPTYSTSSSSSYSSSESYTLSTTSSSEDSEESY